MGDDEELTSTIEEQLADENTGDGEQTQPLSAEDLQEYKDRESGSPSDEGLAQENAQTSLDQPSDGTS